jgi:hypothetical protein
MPTLQPSPSRGLTQPPPYESQGSTNDSGSGPYMLLSTHHLNVSGGVSSQSQSAQEQYPRPDPYVDALTHTESLRQLCMQCRESDRQRILHLGELVSALTQLMRKARTLNALDVEEEEEQLKDLTRLVVCCLSFAHRSQYTRSNVVKIDTFLDSASASAQRRFVWKRAHLLLLDVEVRSVTRLSLFARPTSIQKRLAEEHVASSLRAARQGEQLFSVML